MQIQSRNRCICLSFFYPNYTYCSRECLPQAARSFACEQRYIAVVHPFKMASDPQPFTMQKVLVLKGGYLGKKSMQIPIESADGIELIKLEKASRDLATAVGQRNKCKRLSHCDILQHMASMRNDSVDQHIKQSKLSSDPFAEEIAVEITSDNRSRLFAEAKVPQIVDISFPGFTTPAGKRIDGCSIKMLSTPKKT